MGDRMPQNSCRILAGRPSIQRMPIIQFKTLEKSSESVCLDSVLSSFLSLRNFPKVILVCIESVPAEVQHEAGQHGKLPRGLHPGTSCLMEEVGAPLACFSCHRFVVLSWISGSKMRNGFHWEAGPFSECSGQGKSSCWQTASVFRLEHHREL